MRFRPAIFIAFVFAQFFFKLYNNGGNQKLKAWSFQLSKNYFCTLNIERPRTHQNSITISLIHPVVLKKAFERSQRFDCNVLYSFENFGYIFMSQNDDSSTILTLQHPPRISASPLRGLPAWVRVNGDLLACDFLWRNLKTREYGSAHAHYIF